MRKESISYILPFSAKSKEALENTSLQIIDYLKNNRWVGMKDAAWTLQTGRKMYEKRKVFIASREDLEKETFCFYESEENQEKNENLVFVLPEAKDVKNIWHIISKEKSDDYLLLKESYNLEEQVLSLLPDEMAAKVKEEATDDKLVNGVRAFIIGLGSVQMMRKAGIVPTALAGTGIAELTAMTCAGAVDKKDAVEILLKNGELSTYEAVYPNYRLKNKQIPVMRKAGKKAKMHMDSAIVIKLGSSDLENDITERCMKEVAYENVMSLFCDTKDSYIKNVYQLIAKLWCKGKKIEWGNIDGSPLPYKVPLPTYVFDKKIFDCDVTFGGYMAASGENAVSQKAEEILDITEVLKQLWKEALGIEQPKKEDDFFDLGGSSLDAIMLSAKVKELLKVDFQMSEMFEYSTFGKMEKYMKSHKKETKEDVIRKLEKRPYYETSSAQKRMYAVNEMLEDAIPYNFACVYKVHGKIDKVRIQECFSKLVQRHEAFRTRFEMVEGEVVQIIEEKVAFQVSFQVSSPDKLETVIQENIKPFDLSKAPLLRVAFISISEDEHVMVLDMHHIISDQSSLDILLREIGRIYQGETLPALEVQYKDFAQWQNDFFRSGEVKKQIDYWKNEFSDGIPILDLYTDYARPEVMGHEGGEVHFSMSRELSQKITHLSKEQGVTPYMLTLAALNIMLWKYTNQKDIVIGTAIAGRKHTQLKDIVGMFVNTLAIKSRIKEEFTIAEYLQYIKNKMVNAYDNQDCQFEMLVEELGVPKSTSRNALFDILFNYINIGTDEVEIEGLRMEPYNDGRIDVKFDLTFTLEEKDQSYSLDIEYAKALYRKETIELMGQRFLLVLEQMTEKKLECINEITLMTEQERKWLLETVNQTETDYPSDQTVLQVFEQCVKETEEAVAIEWMEEKITYKQLNNMANQLASLLHEKKVGYQDMVPILLERGPMQMISMLGIMKLGAIYIPIDPKYPQERIDYILEDCNSNILLTEGGLEEKVKKDMEIIKVDAPQYVLDKDCDSEIHSPLTPKQMNSEDIIYAIYTSGSTGKPKGTLLKHKNVVRVVKDTNYIEISKKDRIMQISNYVFDCSVFDIYSALLNSACLVIIPRETALEIPLLAKFIKEKKISAFCISTALFHMLVDWKPEALIDVRKVIVAGEQISLAHAKKAIEVIGTDKLINCYGPTESAVFATYYAINDLSDAAIVPIGYPLANTTVYVTDENQKMLPINVAGELCLGGDGIGKGYLNQEKLTEEKFISLKEAGGKRVYRTGDRVMWNTKRELIFLGRMDFQIKLRGFRVELGEVERQIEGIEGIKNAVVTADKDNLGTLYMTAYYTVEHDAEKEQYNEEYIRSILESKLPEYMVPTKYMLLKQFPLNFSGKVDRKALPKAADPVIQKPMEKDMPRTKTETIVLEAMKKILDIEELGIKDDFFRCGGQSIKAIALVKELANQGITVKVNEIFQCQTAEKLAGTIEPYVEESTCEVVEMISDVELNQNQVQQMVMALVERINIMSNIVCACTIKKEFALSAIQEGHLSRGSSHSGFCKKIKGNYTDRSIKKAVGDLIVNHQLLHCSLSQKDKNKWIEYDTSAIEKVMGNYVVYEDISMYANAVKSQISQAICDEVMNRNYTENELLWRACILKSDKDTYEIIWGANHIVFDGMSGEVILSQIEKGIGKTENVLENPIQNYEEYVMQLKQGPQDITEEEIIQKFHLAEWKESNQAFQNILEKEESKKVKMLCLKIPLKRVRSEDIWWYAFEITAKVMRKYGSMDMVPFGILDYGRSYQEKEYYNSVGEFLDIVPIISERGKRTSVEDVLSICRKHSVNFLTLLKEGELQKKYAKVNELLRQYYYTEHGYFDFILYNFQGYVTDEEKEAFSNVEETILSKTSIVVNYNEEFLFIEIEDAAGIDEMKMRECTQLIINEKDEEDEN